MRTGQRISKPQRPVGYDELARWSGIDGERRLKRRLAAYLTDEWHLYEGYLSSKGEIDAVLVGPLGVLAIEIKNVKGSLVVDGDNYELTRPDEEVYYMLDGGQTKQRSPSEQVSETSESLRKTLGLPYVATAVVFTNRDLIVKSVKKRTVDSVSKLGNFQPRSILQKQGTRLTEEQCIEIGQRLVADHKATDLRRAESKARSQQATPPPIGYQQTAPPPPRHYAATPVRQYKAARFSWRRLLKRFITVPLVLSPLAIILSLIYLPQYLSGTDSPATHPPVLIVTPNTIRRGGYATLSWQVPSDAKKITLNNEVVQLYGSKTVSPRTTTTYRLVVTDSNGIEQFSEGTVVVQSNLRR